MKYLEYSLWAIVSLGVALRLFEMPLAGVLIIVGLTSLSLLYLALGWLLFPTKDSRGRMVALSTLSGIALSILIIGLLFKIQIWPMADLYLLVSIPFLAALLIVVQVLRGPRPELAPYFNGLTKRMLPALIVAVLLYPMKQRTLLNFYYRNQPGKAELIDSMYTSRDPLVKARLHQEIFQLDSAQREQDRHD